MSLVFNNETSLNKLVVHKNGVQRKGTYRIIKTGNNLNLDAVEQGDILDGVFTDEKGNEVLGKRKYLGGSLYNPASLGEIFAQQEI